MVVHPRQRHHQHCCGCNLGCIVAVVCRPPPQLFCFTVIAIGFGNTKNIAYAVVGTICRRSSGNLFGPNCDANNVAYVLILQWVSVILIYSLVYHMMEPPLAYYKLIDRGEDEEEELGQIGDNLTLMAEAAMLVLGGMLAEGPNDSILGIRTTMGIVVARLLVLPAVGVGVVKAAEVMGLLLAGVM
ncbi:Protein PIN-LIKES 2 [Linum perenne]